MKELFRLVAALCAVVLLAEFVRFITFLAVVFVLMAWFVDKEFVKGLYDSLVAALKSDSDE